MGKVFLLILDAFFSFSETFIFAFSETFILSPESATMISLLTIMSFHFLIQIKYRTNNYLYESKLTRDPNLIS